MARGSEVCVGDRGETKKEREKERQRERGGAGATVLHGAVTRGKA